MTLYLSENEAKNLQNGDVHLAKIPDFGMVPFGVLRSVGIVFCTFHDLSFKLNFFSTGVSL